MVKRSITGLLLGITMIGGMIWRLESGLLLLSIILLGSSFEWFKHLVKREIITLQVIFIVLTALHLMLIWVYYLKIFNTQSTELNLLILLPALMIMLFMAIGALMIDPPLRIATEWPCGIFYILVPCLIAAVFLISDFQQNRFILLGLIIINWCNDSFAYFTGRWFGKTPLAPSISPKKTVEGATGGLIAAVLAGFSVNHWLFEQSFPVFQITLLGVSIWFAGTIGDLYESKIKRLLGIKDSGDLLPGHGGFLDRFDSFFYVVVVGIFILSI